MPLTVHLFRPRRHNHSRRWFTETDNRDALAVHGFAVTFAQDNHSLMAPTFILRGLPFQMPLHWEDKLDV